jgi:hypothetical protein
VSHLGDRIAAFVDGQLTPESAERATAHLASCRPCRDLTELERLTKARLGALSGPAPTADFVGRLLAMGGPSGPLPPRPGHVPGSPRAASVPVRATVPTLPALPSGAALQVAAVAGRRARPQGSAAGPTRPAGRPAVLGSRRGRLVVAVAGALSVVGVGVAGVGAGVGAAASGARPSGPLVGSVNGGTGAQLTTSLLSGRVTQVDWFQSPLTTRTPAARFAVRP